MSNKIYIDVEKKRYIELLNAERQLQALENNGVKDWAWYDESMEDYDPIEDVAPKPMKQDRSDDKHPVFSSSLNPKTKAILRGKDVP